MRASRRPRPDGYDVAAHNVRVTVLREIFAYLTQGRCHCVIAARSLYQRPSW